MCVGEGGSGGALALAWADRLLVQRHAVFSVIAPEGAAAILERDASKAPDTAGLLGLTSRDLLDLGVADGLVDESTDAVARAITDALDTVTAGDRRRRLGRLLRLARLHLDHAGAGADRAGDADLIPVRTGRPVAPGPVAAGAGHLDRLGRLRGNRHHRGRRRERLGVGQRLRYR